jgi:hypothetical protein
MWKNVMRSGKSRVDLKRKKRVRKRKRKDSEENQMRRGKVAEKRIGEE